MTDQPPPPSAIAVATAPAAGFKLNTATISVLITVILQAVATISWAAKADSRLATLEAAIAPITDGTVARLDERTRNIERGIERIEGALERDR